MVCLLSGVVMLSFLNKNSQPVAMADRELIVSGVGGFSFRYTVLKQWELKAVNETSEGELTVLFSSPPQVDSVVDRQIVARKIMEQKIPDFEIAKDGGCRDKLCWNYVYFSAKMAQGYESDGVWDAIHFYRTDSLYGALVIVQGLPLRDVLAKRVCETFKFL